MALTCRRRSSGPRRHHCSWWHSDLVESYRLAREAWEAQADAAAIGYATELAEYRLAHPPPTFRQWLVQYRRDREVTA